MQRVTDMNIHTPKLDVLPQIEDAEEALEVLKAWAKSATPTEIAALNPAISRLLPGQELANYPELSRNYDEGFVVDPDYKATLPDLQNGPASLIKGSKQQIQHVGISNFRLPIRFHTRDSGDLTLETSVTGTVSLEAEKSKESSVVLTADKDVTLDGLTKIIDAIKNSGIKKVGFSVSAK